MIDYNWSFIISGETLSKQQGGFEGEDISFDIDNINFSTKKVPEPITGLVLAAGLGGAVLKRAKDKSKKS